MVLEFSNALSTFNKEEEPPVVLEFSNALSTFNKEEPLLVLEFSNALSTFNKCKQKRSPSEKRDGNCNV